MFIDSLFYSLYRGTTKFNKLFPVYYSVGLIILLFYINFLTVCIFFNRFNEIYQRHIDKYFVIVIAIFCFRHFITKDKYLTIIASYEQKPPRNRLIEIFFNFYPGISFVLYLISLKAEFSTIIGLIVLYFLIIVVFEKL
jgi:hypothetical protein